MNITDNQFINYVIYVPKTLTEKITEFLSINGFGVSERWTSLLFTFISLGLFYIGLRITKPLIKWILVVISILLILGMIIPW